MDEITAEFSAEQLVPSRELKVRVRATVAAKSDLGRVRENNEDKFEFYVPSDDATLASRGATYLVCDGMGGHAAGQIASEIAAKSFIDVYYHHPATEPATAMLQAVEAANRFVLDNARSYPQRRGMGTTLTGLVLLQDQAWTIQVGDSRAYRLRGGECVRLTHDHTYAEDAVRFGTMTLEEVEAHPWRHVLTRAIGVDEPFLPDIDATDLQAGDVFMLCSDGVVNHVADDQIAAILGQHGPAEAAWRLVGAALQGGGSDNATVLVVRVDEVVPATPSA